jgi:hypothetical protein
VQFPQPAGIAWRLSLREIEMRSLLKPTMLMALQQNPAGLIADLAILAMFLVLLAVR